MWAISPDNTCPLFWNDQVIEVSLWCFTREEAPLKVSCITGDVAGEIRGLGPPRLYRNARLTRDRTYNVSDQGWIQCAPVVGGSFPDSDRI